MTATLSGHRVLPGGVTIRWQAGAVTSPLPQLLADLGALLARIDPQGLGRPTPCPAFDVRALQHHVLTGLAGFAAVLTGRQRHAATVSEVAEQVTSALDAGVAARTVRLDGADPLPGTTVLDRLSAEVIVHGWDLARATGQAWDPSPSACEAARATMRRLLRPPAAPAQGGREPAAGFSAEVGVPDDASTLDRLLAVTGRDPRWRPPT